MALKFDHYFVGKTAWVTGASSGIGAALAHLLNDAGAHVIISARNIERLQDVQSKLKNPKKCTVLAMDMASQQSIEEVVSIANKTFPQIDLLIHNAGVSQRSLASETNLETDKTIMNVNYFGTITLTKLLLDKMIEKQHGHVVVISSVAGKVGVQYRSAYAASKHALHGFFDSLRAETEPMGIFTTIVCPGYVKTNISLNALKGDGSNYNETDRNHIKAMEPMVLAEKILKSVKNRKREVYYGGKEILIIYIKRYLPTLYYKIIKKIKP